MKSVQQGFTLIELMIVVAIIAILAAIAIPAYQNYLIRAQVSEGMTLMDGAKTGVAEYWSNTGSFPGSNSSAGVAGPSSINGKYVRTVTVGDDGVITAAFGSSANSAINGENVTLTPTTVSGGGSISWTCGGSVDNKYLPSSCRH